MAVIESFFMQAHRLPTMPEVARRLVQTLGRDDVHLSDLLGPIATDPALSTRVLRAANAACYGNRRVGTLHEAARTVGLDKLRNLALSACVVGAFPRVPRLDRLRFWRHALATGGYARQLAFACGLDAERAYFGGFVLRTGQVLMALSLPELVADIEAAVQAPGMRAAIEYARIGCTHHEVTAELARRWQFPEDLVEAFRHASDPLLVDPFNRFAALLAVAAIMADAGDFDADPVQAVLEAEPESLSRLGLTPSALAERLPPFVALVQAIEALT